jgi:hypothetical protein
MEDDIPYYMECDDKRYVDKGLVVCRWNGGDALNERAVDAFQHGRLAMHAVKRTPW